MKILFLGDVFGNKSVEALEKHLPKIINKEKIDFVIAQSENVSGRKGLTPKDYNRLKKAGVNAFTIGNHVWAKKEIKEIINKKDIIRPYNVKEKYEGKGTRVFNIKGKKIRISQLMGITFNKLGYGWKEESPTNFFDAFDKLNKLTKTDYHIIDFHGEVTSEKNVFGLYVDGKATAVIGTHTHVQTNDAMVLNKKTLYITDAGMTGPIHSAIGASYETVYKKMRFNSREPFEVSSNPIRLHGVILHLNKVNNKIEQFVKDLR